MDKRVINLALSFCLIIIVFYIANTQIKKHRERKENLDNQIYDDGDKNTFLDQDEILDYLEEKNEADDFECSYEYNDDFFVFYSKQNKDKKSEDVLLQQYKFYYMEGDYISAGVNDLVIKNKGLNGYMSTHKVEFNLYVQLFDKNTNYASEINKAKEDLFESDEGITVVGFRLAFLFVEVLPVENISEIQDNIYQDYQIDEDDSEPSYEEYYDEESSAYFRDYK